MLVMLCFFTFFLGAFFSCYFQVYCSLGRVYYYWKVLVEYALKERESLVIFLAHISTEYQIIEQQKNWLSNVINVDRKHFCSSGEELMRLFIFMEEELNRITMKVLQDDDLIKLAIKDKDRMIDALEKFWAAKNLFEFQAHNYNNVVQRYFLTQRKRTCCWLNSLLSYPNFPIKIPSFY